MYQARDGGMHSICARSLDRPLTLKLRNEDQRQKHRTAAVMIQKILTLQAHSRGSCLLLLGSPTTPRHGYP